MSAHTKANNAGRRICVFDREFEVGWRILERKVKRESPSLWAQIEELYPRRFLIATLDVRTDATVDIHDAGDTLGLLSMFERIKDAAERVGLARSAVTIDCTSAPEAAAFLARMAEQRAVALTK